VDFDDALSEGICGIYDAIKHFDLNKSVRFNTYSYWRIRAKIQRMNDLNNTVSRAANTNDNMRKYERAVTVVRMNDGSVDAEALLKELGWGQRKLNTAIKAMNSTNGNVIRESEDYSMDNIPGCSESREYELKVGSVAKYIKELVHTLEDDRQRKIIELRFGLGCEPLTLQEVGDKIGVTKERIRQIETLALQKLRDVAPTVSGYQSVI
jgi:RNA polymerase primary sigma factor